MQRLTFAPLALLALTALIGSRTFAAHDRAQLQVENVATGLRTVWDMAWAPDGEMWVTERSGRVSRINVANGTVTPVGEVPSVAETGEAGLLGMAFHPDFPREPFVYFAHSYRRIARIRNRLVRMRYADGRLSGAETLIDGIDGAGNHNGARLAVGPDRLLYMTMGDAGDRQVAQDRTSPNGKILRLTLDGKPAPGNPFGNEVWSWGHRNPQGLAFQPGTGVLYSAEHGQNREDEVNRIEMGANYGWPMIEGMCDEPAEREFCSGDRMTGPVAVFMPTVGVAGAAFYDSDAIPEWRGDLLVVALRGASLYRIELSADGRRSTSVERLYAGEFGRLRDVLVGSDGAIYLATSNHDGRGQPGPDDDRIIRLRPHPREDAVSRQNQTN
jgi:glucose/arabinose dehydrogenase